MGESRWGGTRYYFLFLYKYFSDCKLNSAVVDELILSFRFPHLEFSLCLLKVFFSSVRFLYISV